MQSQQPLEANQQLPQPAICCVEVAAVGTLPVTEGPLPAAGWAKAPRQMLQLPLWWQCEP